jgi:cobalt-zinc-cadmium efflux system protein
VAHAHPPRPTPSRGARAGAGRRLAIVLAITLLYAGIEAIGGLVSNSLALLADSGHMFTDAMALGLALLGAWFASRPPDHGRTYGYQRAEILAALVNGVALVVICGFIFWEAFERLRNPPAIETGLMALVATGGLAVNLAAAAILKSASHAGLNLRAAFLHVLGDLLGSIGALVAAGALAVFGWTWADPVASLFIGLVIVVGSVRLVFDSVNVLMEAAPTHVDTEEVRRCLAGIEGVGSVHDLHVWSLGGGVPILSAHLVVDHTVSAPRVLRAATEALSHRFGIRHSTLQVEPPDFNIVGILESAASRDVPPR